MLWAGETASCELLGQGLAFTLPKAGPAVWGAVGEAEQGLASWQRGPCHSERKARVCPLCGLGKRLRLSETQLPQ